MSYQLAVIGGMGPEASARLYHLINEYTKASKDQDHIDLLILSHASMPDRTQIIKNGNIEDFLKCIEGDIRIINSLDIKAVAVPCNTSHYFFEYIRKSLNAKLIDMIDETAKTIPKGSKVILLATDGTNKGRLYHQALEKYESTVLPLDPVFQQKVMDCIYSIKGGLNPGKCTLLDEALEILYSQGADRIVLGCTELSLLDVRKGCEELVVDALKVLAKVSIKEMGKTLKELETA